MEVYARQFERGRRNKIEEAKREGCNLDIAQTVRI